MISIQQEIMKFFKVTESYEVIRSTQAVLTQRGYRVILVRTLDQANSLWVRNGGKPKKFPRRIPKMHLIEIIRYITKKVSKSDTIVLIPA